MSNEFQQTTNQQDGTKVKGGKSLETRNDTLADRNQNLNVF